MSSSKRHFWPSPKKHSHVLGEVRKVEHGNGRIAALALYETSVCRGEEPADLPPLRASAIIGACSGIVCTVCHELIDWTEAPSETYERLMSHYPK